MKAAPLLATLLLTLPLGQIMAQPSPTNSLTVDINWAAFLSRQDLIWEELPLQWNEGAFIGNGQLGLMAYATTNDNRFDFHLGRQDVTDHRKAPDRKTSMGVPGASVMFDHPRLDVGRMALRPAGRIKDGRLRQDLWNAEITGTITTDLGELRFRAFTPRDRMVSIIEVTSTEKDSHGRPARWKWDFLPGSPASPRAHVFPKVAADIKYVANPEPVRTNLNGLNASVHSLLAGGDFATVWLEQYDAGNNTGTLYISTANEVPAANRSAAVAAGDVQSAARAPLAQLIREHRAWWHEFYPQAFLTIPDARMESFYWIQIYKLASASREGGPAVDLFGPWFRISQWPGIWWNLNIQLTYWPVYAGNHLELGRSYIDVVDEHFDGLLAGFRDSTTLGDFAWAMHNYWWQLRFTGGWSSIHEKWTPKAKAVLAGYLPRLKENAEGKLELGDMGSPEYRGFKAYPHTSYNLALLRWLLNALLEADAHSGQSPDPQAAEWRRILDGLAPYPTDENGLRIARNQAVDMSHRHFSHLVGLYPLYQLNPDAAVDRELVVQSVRHWHRIGNGRQLAGYSFTGGASLYASLGLGDEANAMLQQFLTGKIGISALLANTFYVESGGRNPVIETPLSAASATMDLLLQSWGGKIRVFPAVPTTWTNASFHQLRAMDGFLVSAAREQGRTRWVKLQSEAGEPCVLNVADWSGPLKVHARRELEVKNLAPGEYQIDLRRGEAALLCPADIEPPFVIRPLTSADSQRNLYGVKRGQQLRSNQTWPDRWVPVLEKSAAK